MHLRRRQRKIVFGVVALALWLGATAVLWLAPLSAGPTPQAIGSMTREVEHRAIGLTGWLLIDERDFDGPMRQAWINPLGLTMALAITALAALAAWSGWRVARVSRWGRDSEVLTAHRPQRCRRCGYKLRGLDRDRCPECGVFFRRSADDEALQDNLPT